MSSAARGYDNYDDHRSSDINDVLDHFDHRAAHDDLHRRAYHYVYVHNRPANDHHDFHDRAADFYDDDDDNGGDDININDKLNRALDKHHDDHAADDLLDDLDVANDEHHNHHVAGHYDDVDHGPSEHLIDHYLDAGAHDDHVNYYDDEHPYEHDFNDAP